jgi:hypothetical protein
MVVTRGSSDRKVTFGSLSGGERFYGSVSGKEFMKLDRPSGNKNCVRVSDGAARTVSSGDMVRRACPKLVKFGSLGQGNLFIGSKTKALFMKTATQTRPDGKKSNVVRLGNGHIRYYYHDSALVEPVEGTIQITGK